jgi:hypothetical protein
LAFFINPSALRQPGVPMPMLHGPRPSRRASATSPAIESTVPA